MAEQLAEYLVSADEYLGNGKVNSPTEYELIDNRIYP